MNSGRKLCHQSDGHQHKSIEHPSQQQRPGIVPPKALSHQVKSRPPAPPPYEPQVTPKCLQPKAAIPAARKAPVPPPVYRPQPVPKVLQRKVPTIKEEPASTVKRAPVAPPVYRPQPVAKVLQRKTAANEQARGQSSRLPIASRTGPGATHPARGTIQRSLDQSNLKFDELIEGSTVGQAIPIFAEIEQQDLTPEEFNMLETERQRFMPLMARFSFARHTTLLVTTHTSWRLSDLAITRLYCHTDNSKLEYDSSDKQKFLDAVREKKIRSFVVEVSFYRDLIKKEADAHPLSVCTVGSMLQSFTHEMTVHAENMLDFIEDYWDYVDGKRQALPSELLSKSEEHLKFKQKKFIRYQYMYDRVGGLDSNKKNKKTKKQFNRRHLQDYYSAN